MKDDSVFVEILDFSKSFWHQCPQELHYMEPFASFKSSNKKTSGQIMNAIYLIYDRKSALFKGQPDLKKRQEDVNKNFLKDEKFDWTKYLDIIDAYRSASMTWLQRQVEALEEQLEKRAKYVSDLTYDNPDDAKQKDEMMLSAEKIYEQYIDLQNKAYEELRQKRFEAGYRLSPIESLAKPTSQIAEES